jgi:hypothetical protein
VFTVTHCVPRSDAKLRARRATTCAVLLLLLAACSAEQPTGPDAAGASIPAQYRNQAFTADVNARARTITIVAPGGSGLTAATRQRGRSSTDVNTSLLAGDAVRLVATNLQLSQVGEFAPNMVRVTFDVMLESRLPTLTFVAPTWPAPPAPYVILFPLDYTVITAPGGAAGTDGNTIAIALPGAGSVLPSPTWDGTGARGSGAPFNFFTSQPCAANASPDCFRWVAFGAPGHSPNQPRTRRIGFDIAASVAQFRARLIVAADLAPVPLTP